jgi:flagellar protein FliO/FliZ
MTEMAHPAAPLSVSSLAQLTLSLLAIVALIFAVAWLLKRLKLATPRSSGDIAVLQEISVGPRERVALIRVGDAQVLIGISPGGITTLTPLVTPIVLNPAAPAAGAFAERLRDLMKRPGAGA